MKKLASLFFTLLICIMVTGCSNDKSLDVYKKTVAKYTAGIGTMSVDEARDFAEQNSLQFESFFEDVSYKIPNNGRWEALLVFKGGTLDDLSYYDWDNEQTISIDKSHISYIDEDDDVKFFDTLAECEKYVFGKTTGTVFSIEKATSSSSSTQSSNTTSTSTSSSSSAPAEKAPVIETGITDLYKDGFQTLYSGMGSMTFDEGENIAQQLISKGYSVEITKPTSDVSGKFVVTASDGDKLTVNFYYDFRRTDGKDTLSLLQYNHGKYHICVSDSAHTVENKFEIGDPNRKPWFYNVSSLAECEKFMFGSSTTKEETFNVSLLHGKLLEKKAIGTNLTIKAKIEPSYSNKATVDQNYYNIEDIVKKQGGDKFTEIQYWAVADMTDGSEQKVISFTVSGSVIKKIANGEIVTNQMGNYVDDLFVHASLR